MSLSFGGLGLLSSWTPLRIWDHSVHSRPGFRSFIFALVVLAVLLILAYLTNPTEISFRTYLTEQSFRQHLSHLDDLSDDSTPDLDSTHSRSDKPNSADRSTLPFHFANRASVSLRTPKHIFHSFGVCTIATTQGTAVPAGGRRAGSIHPHAHHRPDPDPFVSLDSWFIGAFGRWWRGGPVESWYYDAMIRSKDAQGWSSGILGFKALDKFHDYDGLPFAKFSQCPRPLLRRPPPKLRNRERSDQRPNSVAHRNSSPPPLPKSASLPLHADHRLHDLLPVTPQSSHLIVDPKRPPVHAPPIAHTVTRAMSTSGSCDHSASIAEVLRQIAAAQASVHDLQNQLEEAQNSANQSRDSLEAELSDLRLRRREEEQRRLDSRTRAKALEETRRQAEISKREAEKKMKVARNAKDSAMRRVEELGLEIQRLKERMEHDRTVLAAEPSLSDTTEEEQLNSELEMRKKEVRVAEEVIVSLNTRARELEEKIEASKSRLCATQHRTQLGKVYPDSLDASHSSIGNGSVVKYNKADNSGWTSSYNPFDVPVDDVLMGSERVRGNSGSESRDPMYSPELAGFSSVLRSQGNSVFDDDTSLSPPRAGHTSNGYFQTTSFSPFREPPTPSAAFIPSSLISVLDSPSADWKGGFAIQNGAFTSSPVEADSEQLDVLDLCRAQGQPSYDQLSLRQNTIYEIQGSDDRLEMGRKGTEASKSWISTPKDEKRRSGLNPDAKVFRLTRLTPDKGSSAADTTATAVQSYDALNPTGLTPIITSSTPSSLLRAFAPSRAEREALQRALGGSTNTSLERLPSLSDVGSIPSSPAHVHADAPRRGIVEKESALPAWLQSLPLIRKPNFSPWGDEDQVSTEVKGK